MEATLLKSGKRLNPQLFSLWVGMASVVMLFGAFTSAYIVKQGAGNWLQFAIPVKFYISTIVIILSSIMLHIGYIGYKNKNFSRYKLNIILATILGITFMVLQYLGWIDLFNSGVDLKANVGGSFFYLITGAHAAHVIGGITVLIISCMTALSLPMSYNEERRNRIEMVLHFWHFLGGLWLYLFLFLNIIR